METSEAGTRGTLSVVATPIGNMEDITLRALRTLRECDAIFCEDTRVTSKLLARHEISGKTLVRCDERQEAAAAERALALLEEGKRVVLVSDAGTPGVSDPGARLVAAVRASGADVTIEAIPGPSALAAAISIAGMENGEFTFLGFLPHKKGRQTALKDMAHSPRPVILYESPHRIAKLLLEIEKFVPGSKVAVAKEITKIHEALYVGTPVEVEARLKADKAERGEFVVIVSPPEM